MNRDQPQHLGLQSCQRLLPQHLPTRVRVNRQRVSLLARSFRQHPPTPCHRLLILRRCDNELVWRIQDSFNSVSGPTATVVLWVSGYFLSTAAMSASVTLR